MGMPMYRTALCLTLAAALGAVAACSASFPYGMSLDRHNFTSSHHLPKRVKLVDTTNGETVWSLDVPVGKKAVVDFETDSTGNASLRGAFPANKVYWDVMPPDTKLAKLQHSKELSGRPVRLEQEIREINPAVDGPEAEAEGSNANGGSAGSQQPTPKPDAPEQSGDADGSNAAEGASQSGGGSTEAEPETQSQPTGENWEEQMNRAQSGDGSSDGGGEQSN